MVAIDFHNTLEVDDWVDEDTLHTLRKAGVKVWVISYGGHKRNQATIETLARYRRTLIAHFQLYQPEIWLVWEDAIDAEVGGALYL